MDTVVKIAGVCICAVCASLIIGDRHRGAAILCTIAAFVSAACFCLGEVSDTVAFLEGIYAGTYFNEYAGVLIKALGIAYITCASSEVCTAAGEGTLARMIGIGGRAELLVLCIPMITKLLNIASGMLENI